MNAYERRRAELRRRQRERYEANRQRSEEQAISEEIARLKEPPLEPAEILCECVPIRGRYAESGTI